MELKAALLKEHSAAQKDTIVRYIGNNKDRFQELTNLFLKGEYRVTQRAAWVISDCAEAHPELVKPYLKKLILHLNKPNLHNAVKRNTLRFLQFTDIPQNLQGITIDICFNILTDKKEAIAVKAFALTVAFNLSKKHPALQHELKIVIEDQLPYSSSAFKSRASKILKELC